jgi:DNA repair exonuclease SbcCD nuclease subunit
MKIAIITDTHFGARNDSHLFDNFFKKFYDEVFFPYLEEHQIKTVFHLGDVFDRRKYINFNTLRSCRTYFFDKLTAMNADMYVIPGNHDTYYKNTNQVNSIDLLLKGYQNIHFIDTCVTKTFDATDFTFIPWICDDNLDSTLEFIRNTKGVCLGHFEIEGFDMFRGARNEGGMDRKVLQHYDKVFTGHFHHRSTDDNIYYLGSPYGFTWSDFDDPRGFHIYDTRQKDITFIENPNVIFHKIYYDDRKNKIHNPLDYKHSCVKLIVVNKTDYVKFDKFVEQLYNNEVMELTIHEDFSEFESEAVDNDNINVEDTMTLLSDFVNSTETDKDKERLKTLLKTLYIEAQNLQV